MSVPKNVLGGNLKPCSNNPKTGYFRNGYCDTCPEDVGQHTVCVYLSDDFLEYSKSVGNDLSTPIPEYNFKGLKAGDKWCLCASRWKEAYENGVAPKIDLEATHESMLNLVPLETLVDFGIDK
ncbi:MAG: DUF2237 domain-containing protein [Melioribacteraceae bacterium]|nr:DUF2237 domain-containing protein [Melioribacteraceae bacterium]MCF8264135.1 DUF2237 domain-containing protein [Melioribacteraceae bacterium]MCF8430759.1 DUF2237 domain-containing protein [Melioribacteraceae bacterium]